MKIGIEAQRLFRKKKHGLEIVALEMIRSLQQLDKHNEYFIFVRADDDNNVIQETENFKIREIKGSSYPQWEQITLPKAIRQEKIDLLHCTANTAPLSLSVPTVLTLHDIIFMEKKEWKGNYYQNFGNLYRRMIVPRVIKKVKKIITVSHSEKELITNYFKLDSSRLDVIYNAVSSSFRKVEEKDIASVRSRFKLPKDFILFFGNLAPKKNSLETLKAYVEYARIDKKHIPLVIAGAFEKEMHDQLNSLKLSPEIYSKVIIIGHVPFSDQPAIYNLAKLFLYTSTRESFGLPIVESMACGTPVITSNVSCMPEIAASAAHLIDPFNYKSIAEGITKVMADEVYYTQLQGSGIERAKKFTWDASAQKLLQIFNEAVKVS